MARSATPLSCCTCGGQRTYHAYGSRSPFVDEGRERGDETADMRWRLRLVAHEGHRFEARVVIDEN
eukprot:6173494-Pleurochrysis_carterae.AAC.6